MINIPGTHTLIHCFFSKVKWLLRRIAPCWQDETVNFVCLPHYGCKGMAGFERGESCRQHNSLCIEKRSLILINGRPQYILPVITTDVLYLCSKLAKPLKSLVRAYLQVNNLSRELSAWPVWMICFILKGIEETEFHTFNLQEVA